MSKKIFESTMIIIMSLAEVARFKEATFLTTKNIIHIQ